MQIVLRDSAAQDGLENELLGLSLVESPPVSFADDSSSYVKVQEVRGLYARMVRRWHQNERQYCLDDDNSRENGRALHDRRWYHRQCLSLRSVCRPRSSARRSLKYR